MTVPTAIPMALVYAAVVLRNTDSSGYRMLELANVYYALDVRWIPYFAGMTR